MDDKYPIFGCVQEALELTQRKFLRQLVRFMTTLGHEGYPYLVLVDLVDQSSQGQGQSQAQSQAQSQGQREDKGQSEEQGRQEDGGGEGGDAKQEEVCSDCCLSVVV